jgi:hypothetical protein
MHIIFGHVSNWQVPILRLLKYFRLNVFYLHIEAKTKIKKCEIATKLKKKIFQILLIILPQRSCVLILKIYWKEANLYYLILQVN